MFFSRFQLTPPDVVYSGRSPGPPTDMERRSLEGSNPELQMINNSSDHTCRPPQSSSTFQRNRNGESCFHGCTHLSKTLPIVHTSGSEIPSNKSLGMAELHATSCRTCRNSSSDSCASSNFIDTASSVGSSSSRPGSSVSAVTVTLNPNYKPEMSVLDQKDEELIESQTPLI